MTVTIWLTMGVLGMIIWNNTVKYENKTIKYIWNILIVLCGGLGLLTGILTWCSSKIG
jgi:hypothetical protein